VLLTRTVSASPFDRPRFQVGTDVLYRKKGMGKAVDPNEGEGMLCQVTSVIGEGKQRRYEIRDADAEAVDAQPYRASLQQMTPIPPSSTVLPDLKAKMNVLALYPGTTTFYKAEVVVGKRKEGVDVAIGPPNGHVRLRFEGEDEAEPDKDVERRYVLAEWTGK
jgi:SAGA-associated factor 29